jgi:hypothetical protein
MAMLEQFSKGHGSDAKRNRSRETMAARRVEAKGTTR